ncbi:MAG: TVP38/TMEM64 family protein [Nitrospirales bacterium]
MKKTAVTSHKRKSDFGLGAGAKIVSWIIILALAYWFISLYDLTVYLQPARFAEFIQTFGVMAPLVFVGIMALAVVVSPIPSLPLDLAAGVAFGPLFGTVYAVIGAEIGAIVSFLIGRALGREVIARLLKSDVVFCEKCSDHHLVGFVFLSRLLPLFSFDLVSYGAGLTNMSLKAFALATLAGMIPPTFALVYFGSSALADNWFVIFFGLILVALLIVLPKLIMHSQSSWWVRLILGKKPEPDLELSSAPEAVYSESSKNCSWCGAKKSKVGE